MGKIIWATLVAVTLAITSVPAAAISSVERAPIPTLGRTTIITGDGPASMKVRLPRRINPFVPESREFSYSATGRGRIVGFAMIKDVDKPIEKAPILYAWTAGRCNQSNCSWESRRYFTNFVIGQNLPQGRHHGYLSPGAYTVYLLTEGDGVPGRVTLTFDNLRGRTTLRPDVPAQVDVPVPTTPDPQVASRENLYWSGSSTDLSGPGLVILDLWMDLPNANQPGTAGLCVYAEGEPPPDEAAYLPGCPAADSRTEPTAARHTDLVYPALTPSLPHAGGGWHMQPVGAHSGYVGLWLKL